MLLGAASAAQADAKRPNIILIMADDMGFSDVQPYGSEIRTPNLDRLAKKGLRFSQYYNNARCCPTRASLLTGLYPHQAGVGHMHVTLDIPKAGSKEAIDFYIHRLRFRPIDQVLDTGTFMQCEGDVEHHNLFLCFRPDRAGFNHVAMEVRDFDEVMEGGNYMIEQGWKESRVAGRHTLGSNIYRFVHCPAGGRIELAADMDRMDKSFETRTWEKNPGHHIWSLKS